VKTVTQEQVGTSELGLSSRVQEALGELVNSAKEGCSRSASASGWACLPS
jgi:hypothetical protein